MVMIPLALEGQTQEPLDREEDGGEPSFPWFDIARGTKGSSWCWKFREFLREQLSYSAFAGYVPFPALIPQVLLLTPSPLLSFPRFFFTGCLAPSTFRCQSVLAHCYSPPIPLAQPSFKLLCQGARSPGGGEGWHINATNASQRMSISAHLVPGERDQGLRGAQDPSLQQHFQICSPPSAASFIPALGFPLGSPAQLGVL